MYQRHAFGAPPPIFTPPPVPYNPKRQAYATQTHAFTQPSPSPPPPDQGGGFPAKLSPAAPQYTNKPLPIPTIAFSATTGPSVADLFNKEMKIYVSPTDYFTTKFRKIFKAPKIKITSSKYARPWIKGPNMGFWQQQLNFAVWCATTGCGVSREMLFGASGPLQLSEQLRTFYQFHVYYTTRKILYEMGGIQSKNALPDSPVFSEIANPYDVASYKRICAEFNIDPSTDFRYTRGKNGGLGTVYIGATGLGDIATDYHYPDPDLTLFNDERITDRNNSGYKANGISFVRNDQGAENQLEHFVPDRANGLTPAGLGRVNRSIEAFGYCILGAQANSRSSIIDTLGTARNTQLEFLDLVDDSIRTLTVSNEPVKYQIALEATKVRLNLAVGRGVLLLPARMIINTESVVGYNNNLRRATDDMKLGVNNQVNQGTKKAGLKLVQARSTPQIATLRTQSTNRQPKPRGLHAPQHNLQHSLQHQHPQHNPHKPQDHPQQPSPLTRIM